ncbi:signal peptidase I [Candidatus Kaiserbacteria bacterium RIFCSPHIGHO2_01_FULL_50_13]|uniref:Signal peptidase I n=1 Tax=Candidatus Kaiserbacteria bacterium RIFCSPLOWO2_01_FULL_50_24 TaxID=1798507 RepID=A0A1F6EJP8_9BACT|nr:MAG: signal peptidase I [Candidatus Kaiserbacteria bacterium RIFCSPHIGHO2_01_FULL_50_13]OGG73532.1 MAG: signal peptidase I [Candidatus Kaiserbacteria bacterium RIFCSPLOWO2_01_FULL_50_24]OGG81580.1 MAG: signal peptidase I [Candidatus Kaiserbacteria bacterium RIFCSPLOWO2_02_FULL_51_13]
MENSLNSQEEVNSPPLTTQDTALPLHAERSFVVYVIVALGLALFIRFFIAAPYVVSGASMEPTFDNWHYLIVDRVSYSLGEPERGDVIIFDAPQEHGKALIKRIIGLPGETVMLSDNLVTIVDEEHPEGFLVEEPYLAPENLGGKSNMGVTLGADEYFVLGDNRRMSSDSRIWGVLPRDLIVGRALVRLYPLNMISVLPGTFRYGEKL